jgi:hypothetical protein
VIGGLLAIGAWVGAIVSYSGWLGLLWILELVGIRT